MKKGFVVSCVACLMAMSAVAQDLTFNQGIIFVNEDRYGPNTGSINFYDTEYDEILYNVHTLVNPGLNLGVTTQHGQLYGGRLFLVSKQANGSEAAGNTSGARLTVLDAATLKFQARLLRFGQSPDSIYDGRCYCAVNVHKGYVATSAGIFVLDVDAMTTAGPIDGTQSSARGDYNSLYYGQCGDMVRFGQYVFAVQQGRGLHVIDPETDRVVKTIPFPNIVTAFVTAGGHLYVANNSREVYDFGTGPYEANFTRIDPVALEVLDVCQLPDDKGALSTWGAWHARMLCVDPRHERVYFNHEEYQNHVSAYDFTTREFTDTLILLPDAADVNWDGTRNRQGLYASAISFDPVSGDMVLQTTEAAPMYAYQVFNHNWVLFYDGETHQLKRQIRLSDAYWFPAMAVYPDNFAPEVSIADVVVPARQETVISMLDAVTDADNMAALAVSTASTADDAVARVTMSGLDLHVTGLKAGRTTVAVTVDSNGRLTSTSFTVTVTAASMRGDVNMDGVIDISDVTALINIVLGSVLNNYDRAAGDLNRDGEISIIDVVALIDVVLGKTTIVDD